jgi:hypothetical protein
MSALSDLTMMTSFQGPADSAKERHRQIKADAS